VWNNELYRASAAAGKMSLAFGRPNGEFHIGSQ
jgi:hypothetical protein